MPNPILEQMQGNQVRNNDILKKFEEFKRQISGSNPNEILNNLLKSGKMTNEQYNQLRQQAEGISKLFK